MSGRFARDDEVAAWRDDGWVVLEGLVGTDAIDAAMDDVWRLLPRPERFHADPARYTPPGKETAQLRRGYPEMPEHGPAFRPEQHRWGREFPFWGSGALDRLAVHPAIVDFAERALATTDIRIYQTQVSAKYTGDADYEQPMHTDRNHSLLPPPEGPPWWHVEMFLYLSDVTEERAPTHLVSRRHSTGRSPSEVFMPDDDPALYAAECSATGGRGSLMAYRNDVFHRGVDITEPGGARFLFNVSFKVAGLDWVGYHSVQPNATHPGWVQFVEGSTPRQLELFGFPPPGHPVWTAALLDATARSYPGLDLEPWRRARATVP
jgi:Phytanoyl-CoA dioxygenase (PhyH)